MRRRGEPRHDRLALATDGVLQTFAKTTYYATAAASVETLTAAVGPSGRIVFISSHARVPIASPSQDEYAGTPRLAPCDNALTPDRSCA